MYDIWYRFNRMDPAEVAYLTVLSGGMRTDEEVDEAFNMVTTMGFDSKSVNICLILLKGKWNNKSTCSQKMYLIYMVK